MIPDPHHAHVAFADAGNALGNQCAHIGASVPRAMQPRASGIVAKAITQHTIKFVLHYRLRASNSTDKPSDESCCARRQLSGNQGVVFETGWRVFTSWRGLPDGRFLYKILGKLGSQIKRYDATDGSNAEDDDECCGPLILSQG